MKATITDLIDNVYVWSAVVTHEGFYEAVEPFETVYTTPNNRKYTFCINKNTKFVSPPKWHGREGNTIMMITDMGNVVTLPDDIKFGDATFRKLQNPFSITFKV